MKLEVARYGLYIRPNSTFREDERDLAYIETVLGLKRRGDFVLLRRDSDEYAGLQTVVPAGGMDTISLLMRQTHERALEQLKRVRECAAEIHRPGLDLAIETLQAAGYGSPANNDT